MTTHHTSGAADLPEALRYTNILDAWATDLPLAGKIAVELLRLHTLTEQQQRELIKESHRTAEQKLRADQMTEQHRHQAALNTEARAQLAALTAQAGAVPLTDEQIKDLQDDDVFFGTCRQIVRAIEAAHGIKEGGQHGDS